MDARITAEAAELTLTIGPKVAVVVTTAVDDLVKRLVRLCDPAVILAPYLAMGGTSVSAIAPTLFHEREVSGLSLVG